MRETRTKSLGALQEFRIKQRTFLSFFVIILILSVAFWTSSVFAAVCTEHLIGVTGCPKLGANTPDCDTIAECPSVGGTWQRGPLYVGANTATCATTLKGELQWSTALTTMTYCNGTAFTILGTANALSISSLTGAIATNSITAAALNQIWNWNTLTNQNALTLSSTSETTGPLLSLTNSNTVTGTGASLNVSTTGIGTSYALNASITGASNTGYAAYFNNANPTGYGVYSVGVAPNYFGGNINIASTAKYEVNSIPVLQFPGGDTTSIAVGGKALFVQTGTGLDNVAIGQQALTALTSGSQNTAIGNVAASVATTVNNLTVAGYDVNFRATSGSFNDLFGYSAGGNIQTGTSNVAFGLDAETGAGEYATGSYNLSLGDYAAFYETVGASYNTTLGANAGYGPNYYTTNSSTVVGASANSDILSGRDDAFGYYSLGGTYSGSNNLALGYASLEGGTQLTGSGNTGVGQVSLAQIGGAAIGNTGVGGGAAYNLSTGTFNTAIGYNALYNIGTSISNTAAGYEALYDATAGPNDVFGYDAGTYVSTGTSNVAIGYEAMLGATGTPLTGNGNTAVGNQALSSIQGAATANTALGYEAGYAGTAITTGTNNTFIGYEAQSNNATYTNGTALGANSILTASNAIVLGNSSITTIYAHVTTITGISDRRLKKDINDLGADLGLGFIEKLKPVSYRYKNGDETKRYGFIAQDLEEALPAALQNTIETAEPEQGLALINRQNDEARTYRVAYGELTAPIVKAIQEQEKLIADNHHEIMQLNLTEDPILQKRVEGLNTLINNEDHDLFIIAIGMGFLTVLLASLFIWRRKVA